MARTQLDIRDDVKKEAVKTVKEVRQALGVEGFTLSELVSDALQHFMAGGLPGYEPRQLPARTARCTR